MLHMRLTAIKSFSRTVCVDEQKDSKNFGRPSGSALAAFKRTEDHWFQHVAQVKDWIKSNETYLGEAAASAPSP